MLSAISGASFQASIGQDRIPQQNTIYSEDVNVNSIFEVGLNQISSNQIGMVEVGSGQSGAGQISTFKITTSQASGTQSSSDQGSISQYRIVQNGSTQDSLSQSSSNQVGRAEINFNKMYVQKPSTHQIDALQISAFEQGSSILQINGDATKISLPSSITLQQFLSSHHFDLQNTTIPTWTEFLTGTTLFNPNITIAAYNQNSTP